VASVFALKSLILTAFLCHLLQLAKDGNLRLDAFTAAPKMFQDPRTTPLNVRYELYFVDYDMTPLLIQQAYPSTIERSGGDAFAKLARLSRAADCIADADIMDGYVRSRQAWSLLPSVAACYTRATAFATGPTTVIPFPTWLGKNSSRNKRLRLLAELGVRIAANVSGGREAVRLDYFEALRNSCYAPLLRAGGSDPAACFAETMHILDTYSMSRVSCGCAVAICCLNVCARS
jgi:replication factor C subunit 1